MSIPGDGVGLMMLFCRFATDDKQVNLETKFATQQASGVSPKMTMGKKSLPPLSEFPSSLLQALTLPNSAFDAPVVFTDRTKASLSYSGRRKILTFPQLSLALVKDLKSHAKCSVNDVMYSLLAGGIRRYCVQRNDPEINKADLQFRSLMAFGYPRKNLFDSDKQNALYNKFVTVSADMCLKDITAAERLVRPNQ